MSRIWKKLILTFARVLLQIFVGPYSAIQKAFFSFFHEVKRQFFEKVKSRYPNQYKYYINSCQRVLFYLAHYLMWGPGRCYRFKRVWKGHMHAHTHIHRQRGCCLILHRMHIQLVLTATSQLYFTDPNTLAFLQKIIISIVISFLSLSE